MILRRKSRFSGKEHEMELPISEDDLRAWIESGVVIQRFFPQLTADQREFILTGVTPEEWNEMLGDEEDAE